MDYQALAAQIKISLDAQFAVEKALFQAYKAGEAGWELVKQAIEAIEQTGADARRIGWAAEGDVDAHRFFEACGLNNFGFPPKLGEKE